MLLRQKELRMHAHLSAHRVCGPVPNRPVPGHNPGVGDSCFKGTLKIKMQNISKWATFGLFLSPWVGERFEGCCLWMMLPLRFLF